MEPSTLIKKALLFMGSEEDIDFQPPNSGQLPADPNEEPPHVLMNSKQTIGIADGPTQIPANEVTFMEFKVSELSMIIDYLQKSELLYVGVVVIQNPTIKSYCLKWYTSETELMIAPLDGIRSDYLQVKYKPLPTPTSESKEAKK